MASHGTLYVRQQLGLAWVRNLEEETEEDEYSDVSSASNALSDTGEMDCRSKRSVPFDDSECSSVSLSLTSERDSGGEGGEDDEEAAHQEASEEDDGQTDEWKELYRLTLDLHQPATSTSRRPFPLAFHQRRVDTLCGMLQSSAWAAPFLHLLRNNPCIELMRDEAPTPASTCDACHRECNKLVEVKLMPSQRNIQLGHDCIRRVLLYHTLHHLAYARKERLTSLLSLAELPERCRRELARIEKLQSWAVAESARPHTWFAQLVAMLEESDLAVSAPVYSITMAEDGTVLQTTVGAPATRNALAHALARFRLREFPWMSESEGGWEPLPTLKALMRLELDRSEWLHVGPLQVKCVTRQFVLAEPKGSVRESLQLVGAQHYPLSACLATELEVLERRESIKTRQDRRVRKRR